MAFSAVFVLNNLQIQVVARWVSTIFCLQRASDVLHGLEFISSPAKIHFLLAPAQDEPVDLNVVHAARSTIAKRLKLVIAFNRPSGD